MNKVEIVKPDISHYQKHVVMGHLGLVMCSVWVRFGINFCNTNYYTHCRGVGMNWCSDVWCSVEWFMVFGVVWSGVWCSVEWCLEWCVVYEECDTNFCNTRYIYVNVVLGWVGSVVWCGMWIGVVCGVWSGMRSGVWSVEWCVEWCVMWEVVCDVVYINTCNTHCPPRVLGGVMSGMMCRVVYNVWSGVWCVVWCVLCRVVCGVHRYQLL